MQELVSSAPWAKAYGIPAEPWVFVVGANGRVAGWFEIIVGTDEVQAAIRSVSGGVPAGSCGPAAGGSPPRATIDRAVGPEPDATESEGPPVARRALW